ncbi:SMR family transporter, partial [Capnocytophaga bilenii]|uniref:SMR family transporter n=1 Tax=Capnocytophaga bilenii TaxID=2819369 RepID=UPI0028D0C8FD
PLGVAYAIWSGVGIVLTAVVSILVFKNKIDLPFVLGSLLIIAGVVVVINLFSKANGH